MLDDDGQSPFIYDLIAVPMIPSSVGINLLQVSISEDL